MSFSLEKISEILKVKLTNEELFRTAFTHRSYLNEHPEYKNPSNERLEFLGDAVLQLLSSEFLYKNYEDKPEGDLTNYRSAIVCTPSIGAEAKRLGYGDLLLLSNGEEATGGRSRESARQESRGPQHRPPSSASPHACSPPRPAAA